MAGIPGHERGQGLESANRGAALANYLDDYGVTYSYGGISGAALFIAPESREFSRGGGTNGGA